MDTKKTKIGILTVLILLGINLVPVGLRAEKSSLKFMKDLVIGKNSGDNNFIFSAISDVDLDKNENIYILDAKDYRIQKFDNQGMFLNSITLSRGQGPEEISFFPIMAVTPEGEIAVLDRMARKILIYTIDGTFKRFFKLDFQPIDLEFYTNGNLALLGLNNSKIIHIFNMEGQRVQSFGDPFSIPKKHSQYKDMPNLKLPNRFDSSQDGTLYLLNPHKYEILVYTDGNLEKQIAGKNELYRPTMITQTNTGGIGILFPVMYTFGWQTSLFVTLQGPGMDPENQMEVFKDDKSLFSQVLMGFPYAIDNKGRLYIAEADEFPVMVRYGII
ncbi:MAG: 6-bladed beta-propeller [Candidatus Aminicenantes bacterium]|nr:6-bladed beta-propeller [Candidatus Aminicenantes bacterium]